MSKQKKIVAEIDFDHSPDDVTLRFYQSTDDGNIILRIQELFNIVKSIQRDESNNWRDIDQRLLRQLWPHINKPYIIKSNLQILKLSKVKFKNFHESWSDYPERFIEKNSRAFYEYNVPTAKIEFELESLGAKSKLSAKIKLADNTSYDYFKVKNFKAGTETLVSIKNLLYRITEFPIKKEILDSVFGTSIPVIPTSKIVEHLPSLLQNRFDILSGPSVNHIQKPVKPHVKLCDDGADIMISIQLNGTEIDLSNTHLISHIKLIRNGNVFEVVHYSSKSMKSMIDQLKNLNIKHAYGKKWKLAGTTENLSRLCKIHQSSKDKMTCGTAPNLRSIFEDARVFNPVLSLQRNEGWLDMSISCESDSLEIDQDQFNHIKKFQPEFIRTGNGSWIRIDNNSINNVAQKLDNSGFELGYQRVPITLSKKIIDRVNCEPDLRIQKSSRDLINELVTLNKLPIPKMSSVLAAILREYQKSGAEFLFNRNHFKLGCILADEMGLGKTIQLLAYIDCIINQNKNSKFLVVCPSSVISVWVNECHKFTPNITILNSSEVSRTNRKTLINKSENWDVSVTSYALLRNDIDQLKNRHFHAIILDEAHYIKNPETEICRAVKKLNSDHRIALTGTPLENKLIDLWSIIDFLNPGFLGSLNEFKSSYTNSFIPPEIFKQRISPLILRRTKREVETELPERTEEIISMPLSAMQAKLYKTELESIRKSLNKNGIFEIFAGLTRLRQICCDARLLKTSMQQSDSEDTADFSYSAKLACLIDRLLELRETNHSVLIFSQFTSMLELIETELNRHNFNIFKITGKTPVKKRTGYVEEFQESTNPSVFLLSLKAASTGLTLTRADYVFIYDPWWNPAVENQAIDRTHRIGQDKPVIAYRLVVENTIEEKIILMQNEKRKLFSEVIENQTHTASNLSADDLIELLS